MVSDGDLIERLEAVQLSVDDLREDYRLEAVKRDRRIRLTQIAIGLAIVVACVACGVGVVAVKTAKDANHDRAQRTIVACQQYNKQQADQASAEITQSHDLVNALARGVKDDAERAKAVDAYNKTHDALIRGEHEPRDCSPAGIAAFYKPKGKT